MFSASIGSMANFLHASSSRERHGSGAAEKYRVCYDCATETRVCRRKPMIKASRVGHATFETPDLDRAIAYYTDVNGLVLSAKEKGRAFLASKIGLLSIAIEQGHEAKLKRLSFEVSPNANFADMAKRLS